MAATYSQESLSRPFLYLLLAKQNISLLHLCKLSTTQCGFGFFHLYSLSFNGWHCLPSLQFKKDGLFIYFHLNESLILKKKEKHKVTSYCCVFCLWLRISVPCLERKAESKTEVCSTFLLKAISLIQTPPSSVLEVMSSPFAPSLVALDLLFRTVSNHSDVPNTGLFHWLPFLSF